jgi:hypothetical protein
MRFARRATFSAAAELKLMLKELGCALADSRKEWFTLC